MNNILERYKRGPWIFFFCSFLIQWGQRLPIDFFPEICIGFEKIWTHFPPVTNYFHQLFKNLLLKKLVDFAFNFLAVILKKDKWFFELRLRKVSWVSRKQFVTASVTLTMPKNNNNKMNAFIF